MLGVIVLVVVVAALLFWVIGAYNGLVALKNQVANAWKQIDVQLKRRHDLIPNLVNTVKGAMQFERDTLEAVVTARSKAIAVQSGAGPAGPSVAQTAAAETQLSGALSKLFAVVEAYPDLKATGNVAQLQEELTSTENKIAFARQLYNDTATEYNTKQQQFPTSLVAGMAGAKAAELWEITDAAERENVNVNLSMAPPTQK
jgi:LemA protein